jgi:hypothetical protein
MLQAGRSRFRVPMRSLNVSISLILPTAVRRWGLLSLLHKRVPEYLSEVKAQPARMADNLTTIYGPVV